MLYFAVESITKKADHDVLPLMVIYMGSIPMVLDTSSVKTEITISVSIRSLMLLPIALSILNDITFTIDPLSISTLYWPKGTSN